MIIWTLKITKIWSITKFGFIKGKREIDEYISDMEYDDYVGSL